MRSEHRRLGIIELAGYGLPILVGVAAGLASSSVLVGLIAATTFGLVAGTTALAWVGHRLKKRGWARQPYRTTWTEIVQPLRPWQRILVSFRFTVVLLGALLLFAVLVNPTGLLVIGAGIVVQSLARKLFLRTRPNEHS